MVRKFNICLFDWNDEKRRNNGVRISYRCEWTSSSVSGVPYNAGQDIVK